MDIEIIKQRAIDTGYIPLFTQYNKNTDKLLCETKEGYLGYVTNGGLMRGDKISTVHYKNPYSIYNINIYIRNHNLQCELITDKWESHKSPLLLKCPICNEPYECLWTTLQHKPDGLCPSCVITKLAELKRTNIEVVKQALIDKGYVPLFNVYESNSSKLLIRDSLGYLGDMTYKQLLVGNGFFPFHPENNHTLDNIKLYLKSNGDTCKLLSNEYVNNLNLLDFQCDCGRLYQASLTSILRQNSLRCDVCNKKTSNLEYLVDQWLEQNKLKFHSQYRFNDCRNVYPLPFDFMLNLNGKIYVIEVNGIQHYQPQEYFGGIDAFVYRCNNDKIKKEYCINNNIIFIEISYKDFIQDEYAKILTNKLLP